MFSLNHKKLGPRLVGLGIAGCVVLLVGSSTTTAGETLYNGIVLPDQWPPDVRTLGDDPMPVPYLENPPAVISHRRRPAVVRRRFSDRQHHL